MPRWLIAIAFAWAAWAVQQPGLAYAHARSSLISEFGPAMCSEGSQTVLPEGFAFGRARTLLLSAAPASPGTADGRAAVAVDEDEGPIAWCISPDDPRCTPRDQGAPLQNQRAHTPMQDVSALQFPELAFGHSGVTLKPGQLGAPRAGVGLRLERPPEQR
jgi:hypothetical protein